MVQPEDGVICRNFHDAHVTQAKDVVKAVMQCLEVANGPAIGLVADLIEGLISRQQLVKHVSKVRLLFANASVHLVIAAGSICCKSIKWVANCMVPFLELEFTLDTNVSFVPISHI